MHREEVHESWAPPEGVWSLWVKPVLFAQMPEDVRYASLTGSPPAPVPWSRPWSAFDVSWAPPVEERVVLVVDLAGWEAVQVGMALAQRGYRPVPLFNACIGPHEVIGQGSIQRALREGAADLRALALPADAPPAFLLDRYRQAPVRPVRPGDFDNRWWVYPEDFPSPALLRGRGFARAVVVQRDSRRPLDDLTRVLREWQEAGLRLAVKDLADDDPSRPLVVFRPGWFWRALERLFGAFGRRRSPPGGFGYVVQQPRHG
jgi:hypothetical protein